MFSLRVCVCVCVCEARGIYITINNIIKSGRESGRETEGERQRDRERGREGEGRGERGGEGESGCVRERVGVREREKQCVANRLIIIVGNLCFFSPSDVVPSTRA